MLAYLLCRYFASNGNQYCTSSESVEHQLSMRFLSRLIASIWILYTAITKPVLFWRLAYLLCRYFRSNSNQYGAHSKSIKRQLSLRFLCRLIASIWILFRASTKPVLFRRLEKLICPQVRIAESDNTAQYWPNLGSQESAIVIGPVSPFASVKYWAVDGGLFWLFKFTDLQPKLGPVSVLYQADCYFYYGIQFWK